MSEPIAWRVLREANPALWPTVLKYLRRPHAKFRKRRTDIPRGLSSREYDRLYYRRWRGTNGDQQSESDPGHGNITA